MEEIGPFQKVAKKKPFCLATFTKKVLPPALKSSQNGEISPNLVTVDCGGVVTVTGIF